MLPQLRSFMLENWSDLGLGGRRPRDLTFLVQATGVTKLCCFVFADDAAEPQWVTKMTRSPRDNGVLTREYGLVQHLRQHGSGYVQATVPGPLVTTTLAGHLVGIEAYYSGRPMDGLIMEAGGARQSETRRYLDLALGWLLRSQRETPIQPGRLTDGQIRTHFLNPIMQLQAAARLTRVEQAYLDHLKDRIAERVRQPLPLVFNHGDFRPGNILIADGALQVIDWEFGAPTALPLLDVFGFLTRTYARFHGQEEIDGYLEDYVAAFEAVFFEGGAFAHLTAEYVERACRVLDIDPAWVDVLLVMHLVTEANKYHAFLSQRAERGYVYLLRSRLAQLGDSLVDQLARQKNVWLLGHLAQQEKRLVFQQREPAPGDSLVKPDLQVVKVA